MATKTNCTINGKEYYRIRRTVDHVVDSKGNVKPVIKTFYGTSRKDAEKQYDQWKEEQILERERRKEGKVPLGELMEFYVNNVLSVSSKYAYGTISRYTQSYNSHIRGSSISRIMACDVKPMDIQLFYNSLDISAASVRAVNKFMATFFKWASLNGFCDYPLAAVELPRKAEVSSDQITVWDDADLDTVLMELGNHRLRFFILMAVFSGLRFSELIAIKYSDFDGNILHVQRQYYLQEIKPPKWNSVRDVPIHPDLIPELERHKTRHNIEMKKNHYRTQYVFTTDSGGMLDNANVRRSLHRYYKRIGVSPLHFHAFRATFCTNLCKIGVPLQTASKLMGHKSIEVTSRYYTDVSMNEKASAIGQLTIPRIDSKQKPSG